MVTWLLNARAFFLLILFTACFQSPGIPVTLPADVETLEKIVNTRPDSIEGRLKKIADTLLLTKPVPKDAATCRVMFLYAKALFLSGKIDQSFDYAQKGKYYAHRAELPLYEGKFTGQMGYKYFINAQYDSAAIYFSESMQLFAAIPDSSEYYKSAVNWANAELKVHNNTPQVLDIIRKAVVYYQKNGPPATMATAVNNLAQCYGELKMRDSARYYFALAEQSLHLLPASQKPQVLLNIGIAAEEDGDFQKALKYYEAAEALKHDNPRIGALVQCNQGITLHKLGRMDESEQHLKAALALLPTDSTFRDIRQMALYELAALYSERHQWQEAYWYERKSTALRDTIAGTQTQENLNTLRTQYHTAEHLRTIEQQKAAISQRNYAAGLLSALLLAASAFILVFWQRNRARHKQLEIEKSLNQSLAQQIETEQQLNQLLQEQNDRLTEANSHLQTQIATIVQRPDSEGDLRQMPVILTNQDKTVLRLGDIIYVESRGNFVTFYTSDDTYHDWQALNHYEHLLAPTNLFVRTHRSYLVNRLHVAGRRANELKLSNGDTVSIAKTPETKAAVHEWLDKWLGEGHTAS